ncbi:MAG: MraY family glycosyltransferase [Thermodesulfobacteriota bacterium]|nr:MraY family glycosyltransferase [Thermodesulfobacteriota bacterium]
MTTILFTFIAAFLFALVATPLVKKVALQYGLVDEPSDRKVHELALPRIGGVVIFFAFLFPFTLFFLFNIQNTATELIVTDDHLTGFVVGAIIVFLVGLLDDIKKLSPAIKFGGQILAALAAYYWGFRIGIVSIPFTDGVSLGFLSLPITLFWFVLVINAINLIDGLDGLAAGICFFVSLAMLFVCSVNNHIFEALAFASLAGSLLGFLRYNFNPASIFMGDCGSYFLGYTLAALSIHGSIKGQFATAMLIPFIALGVPLIDTMWAPFRRFVLGRKMFRADNEHIHHRLIKMGYTQRRAVLMIYILTIILGVASITIVHTQNDTSALILFVLGIGLICTVRFLGISDFFTMRRITGWARDLTDEAGISHGRRSFLNHQLTISNSGDCNELWQAVCNSLKEMEFDCAEFSYFVPEPSTIIKNTKQNFTWQRHKNFDPGTLTHNCLLKLELPLHHFEKDKCLNFGTLLLIKDIHREQAGHYTLKRVEHLRRTMVSTLLKITPPF